ncbi:TrmB family transcriptional regulator sugar-binding domain-containing protein [Haloarchaeobius amylolyticus]|uniref:TrmB family transcriptional regulator sugar-binding domain-containing protein n=1 Tax=Haloarchaeobius amylolyticus TaxID=1198296 RepID=UPI00226D95CE|nr:TrmB family transcriptional regulator sugar-binding domain-containing protein [Haloarchaeobius amylolyticus]
MEEMVTVEHGRAAALDRLADHVAAAQQEVVLLASAAVVEHLADELAAARDRGVLVAVLFGDSDQLSAVELEQSTSVARRWDIAESGLSIAAFDGEMAMVAGPGALTADRGLRTVFLADQYFEDLAFSTYFGNFWPVAEELYTADPEPLPRTFGSVRHAACTAALHLRAGRALTATVEAHDTTTGEQRTLSGQVINARQSIVTPITASFPLENTLILSSPVGRVSVGGEGAFVEDYGATEVKLTRRE